MTCVVGLVDSTGVHIGADSAECDDNMNTNVRVDPKIFRCGEFVLAFADSFRVGQLLQHQFKPPKIGKRDLYKYMVVEFVDAIRKCLKKAGACAAEKATEESFPADVMVGIRGRLFVIHGGDYQVAEVSNGVMAIGCGREYALGAMAVTTTWSAEQRIRKALEVAGYYSAGVRPPYVVLKVLSR